MLRTLVTAIAVSFALATSAVAQDSYNPGKIPVPQAKPAAKPAVEPQASEKERAQKHYASWQDQKLACYRAIGGLEEGKHFRLNEDTAEVEVDRRVWIVKSLQHVHDDLYKCKAIVVGR